MILSADQKSLQVNLDPKIYGTFIETGAGQEVVRYFFRAGMASGTIAKTMSAYDKDFSDAIYGKEKDGRYVCESRLQNMIEKEYGLLEDRLDRKQHKDTKFFAFANTMTTINHEKTMQGHGWMGIRFQLDAKKEANNVILHVRLNDADAKLQQETIGIIGANLVYACFFNHDDPKKLLKSLYDNLSRDNIEIDMIKMTGPDFKEVDNRLLSLTLVKERMTDAVIFSPDGNHYPDEIRQLVEKIKDGYDQIVISRFEKNSKNLDAGLIDAFGNRMFAFLVNVFFGGHMTDPLTGCRIIKRKAMNEINLDALKMDSTTQMSIRGLKIGQKIEEIEGNEGERIGGERKMRPVDVGLQISYQIIKEFIFWRRKND